MVIIDDEEFSLRLVQRIQRSRHNQGESREHFTLIFSANLCSVTPSFFAEHEQKLMELEENVNDGKTDDFLETITPIRKELLILRSYYDEIMDLGRELEEDENGCFEKKQKNISALSQTVPTGSWAELYIFLNMQRRCETLISPMSMLSRTRIWSFLRSLSTIFFPLTLITGWYGMNFQNMPELREGIRVL